jgi:nucleoside phosphorylase
MSSPRAEPDIGIITALPIECFAVQTVLNDLHEASDINRDDWSTYYFGTLPSRASDRPHSVVLCLLTEDGGVAAAHGCASLARTWPVRHIIMCGIACGVPNPAEPERHVRLGDILVAEDGVVPYGHVRVDSAGEQLRRPAARPSVVLRNAARRLRTGEEAERRPWERWLDVTRRPDLAAYARPPASTDVLYDDETGERLRHPPSARSFHRPGWPRVHHGWIGSGGKLIRTSVERNRLARQHRLIGLDMEGDGVSDAAYLDGVDWFMVRGVSDYGSLKNDAWHRYAALAAAAYTRALLEQVEPARSPRPAGLTRPSRSAQRSDQPVPDPEALVGALLEIRTMRERAGRDRVVATLPDASRIPRQRDAYHDVRAMVEVLGRSADGLTLLLAALREIEGDSRPVRRLASLLDNQ